MTDLSPITAAYLREILRYDPESGDFTWLRPKPRSGSSFGDKAGCASASGYRTINIGNRAYKEHRLAFLWMTGAWPREFIDHRNGEKGDNRWANLREATHSENAMNAKVRDHNKSGFKGVCLARGRWQASIKSPDKIIYLGRFDTPEEAHAAYRAAARVLFGEFARFS